jgi:hypothetical protein
MTKLAVIFLITYAAHWFFDGMAEVGVWWIAMIIAMLGLNKSLETKREELARREQDR